MTWLAWLAGGEALAWEHIGLVHQEPLLLEITTTNASGAPEGAVQQAIRQAVDLWLDDACLETLEVTLVDSELNVLSFNDDIDLVSVDNETYNLSVTYSTGSGPAFVRFGEEYDAYNEVDISMGPAEWDLDAEVLSGSCDGYPLSLAAAKHVGYAFGMDWPDEQADSLYNLPDCSLPALGTDDRAGLRALYGSGVSADCELGEVLWVGFETTELPLTLCEVSTYGTSPALQLWVETEDGQQHPVDETLAFDVPGIHAVTVCGEFDVAEGCDQPVVCAPWPQQVLVCEIPDPAPSATFEDGSVHLADLTVLTDPSCIFEHEWSVLDQDGVEVASSFAPDTYVDLPGPGLYEVVLTLRTGDHEFTGSIPFEWVEEPVAEEPEPEVQDPAETAKEGCGCDQGSAPALGGLLVLLLALRRKA